MQMQDLLHLSLRGAGRHPLRSLLAVLGITVSIGALVTILAGEQSWQQAFNHLYKLRGVDVIRVQNTFSVRVPSLPGKAADMRGFLIASPSVSSATPVADGLLSVKYGRVAENCRVRGLLPGFEGIFGTRLLRGRFFTEAEEKARAPVCIVDADCARVVLRDPDILGKEIRVAGHRLRVIGVADKLWAGGLRGPTVQMMGELYRARADYISYADAGLAVPLSTARRTLSLPVQWLGARAEDHAAALRQIAHYFRLDTAEAQKKGVLFSLAKEQAAVVQARRRVRFFIGLATLLVLFSSGVGLASVMYVAVNERQREIGIHRALGASGRRIRLTFLLESLWLGAIGGIAGLGLGFLGAVYLGTIGFPHEYSGPMGSALNVATSVLPDMQVAVEWQALLVAVAAALLVAMLAGYIPASEAARLNPNEAMVSSQALRYRLKRVLTSLQVGVGIAALLLLTSIYEGIALEQLGGLANFSQADTAMTDLTLTRTSQEMRAVAEPMKKLTRNAGQVGAIARESPAFTSIEAQVGVAFRPLKYGRNVVGAEGEIEGVTPGYLAAEKMRLVEGRFFRAQEFNEGKRVVVLTDQAAAQLDVDPAVGATVRIGGLPFEVVGVVQQGAEAASQYAYVPITSIPENWTAGYPYTAAKLRAHLKSESHYGGAEKQLLAALARRLPKKTMQHLELRGNLPDRYRLTGLRRASALRAAVIGFSALLIALIGLVNMLLVSVSEQTREIGLRRALGATRSAVALAVVWEALLICLPGCMVGVGLGIVAAHYVGGWAHLSTAVPAFWIVVSVGVALLGGLVASLLPALRAALLHPVAALRHE